MPKTVLHELGDFGQSIWLDYISRPLLESGKLKSLIDLGLRGMTSNPSIFNDAIGTSKDYDEKIIRLNEAGKSAFEIYDDLTVGDIQEATDIFRSVYENTNYLDGYVSLEINPKLATKKEESIKEGRRLFKKVNRPNVMIKVPATEAGYGVIEELLADGINVNVTLIFSLDQYAKTVEAFFKGMNRLAQKGGDLTKMASVASIFVSRIDTLVDGLLDDRAAAENDIQKKSRILALKGRAAVANSELIYETFRESFSSQPFELLAKKGCRPQRVLWASTGTKNPLYSDIKYITELIAKSTVNTLPEKTINAFCDHGVVKEAIADDFHNARNVVTILDARGVDMDKVCEKLLADGLAAFEKSFDTLLRSIETKANSLCVKS